MVPFVQFQAGKQTTEPKTVRALRVTCSNTHPVVLGNRWLHKHVGNSFTLHPNSVLVRRVLEGTLPQDLNVVHTIRIKKKYSFSSMHFPLKKSEL